MYLNNPSISELHLLELPLLIEMLSHQTAEYLDFLKREGHSARTLASKEAVDNIQAVIRAKINTVKRASRKADLFLYPKNNPALRANKGSK
jgi:hypothetical protein